MKTSGKKEFTGSYYAEKASRFLILVNFIWGETTISNKKIISVILHKHIKFLSV